MPPNELSAYVHCVLIGFGDAQVLTDLWFSHKFGYYPGEALGRTLSQLPLLSGVVVSLTIVTITTI